MLAGKRILIGIGGGIAVYRVAELARLLKKSGAEVRCVMTKSACEFVTPMTFEALTGEQVHTRLFDLTNEREMGHIKLARWADVVLIAPATASLLARLAHGIADDLLSTIMQVCEQPVLLAPTMNTSMWQSDATRRNLDTLTRRGMSTVGPESGELACGEHGAGRLAEPVTILAALTPLLCQQTLQGQRWVINAGPTHEAWDGVRILSNRASGKLGALLAEQAANQGAETVLIAGPGTPSTASHIERCNVETAEQMLAACQHSAAGADVFIGTAAVSDFRFANCQTEKLKRGDSSSSDKHISIELIVNADIIAQIAAMPDRPTKVIAFAAESSKHIEHAKVKLKQKNVDAIIANDIHNMGSDQANGWWITANDEQSINSQTKHEFSQYIIKHIMELT